MKPILVNYLGKEYQVEFRQYMDGNTSILLFGNEDDSDDFMPATVNLGLHHAPSSLIIVDDWQGLADALKEAGIIEEFIGLRRSGFVDFEMYMLTDKAIKQMEYDFERMQLEVYG